MLQRLLLLLGIVAAIGGLGAGCGGSDEPATGVSEAASTETTGSTGLTFAEEATKLCDESRQQYLAEAPQALAKAAQRSGGSVPQQQLEVEVVKTIMADSIYKRVDKVRALEIPKSEMKQVEDVLAAIEDVAEKAREQPAKFLYQQANFKHPWFKARHMADKYGIGHCAR